MPPGPLALALRQIRHFLGRQADDDLADGQLLQRFVTRRDQAAFAALMHRHAPLVFGVCHRVLHHPQDAEDVFQATFLVLARRAAAIREHAALASWLHQVAYHLALRARADAARRRLLERGTDAMPTTDPSVEAMRRELRPLLDEELQRLPEKYRSPLLLCHLEGKTHEQAARELGWPTGTMSRRLARARDLLRSRLRRRGVTLPATLLVPALAAEAVGAKTPNALLDATREAAGVFATDRAIAASRVTAHAVALAEGALQAMAGVKLKAVAALLLLVGVLAGGAGLLGRQVFAAKPPVEGPPPVGAGAPPQAEEKRPVRTDAHGDPLPAGALARLGSARLRHGGHVMKVAYAPNGQLVASAGGRTIKLWDTTTGRLVRELVGHADPGVASVAFSPDSKLVASGGEDRTVRIWDTATGKQVHLLRAQRFGRMGLVHGYHVAFAPDGTAVISGGFDGVIQVWDLATGQERLRLRPPEREQKPHEDKERITALAIAPDGKTVAAANADHQIRLWDLVGRRGAGVIPVKSSWVRDVQFAPDSKTLAWCGTSPAAAQPSEGIVLWDLAAGKARLQLPGHRTGRCYGLAFSRDGHRLASSGYDNAVKVWDPVSGKELRTFIGHTDTPWSVAFAPDGLTLASGSSDGSVRLWDVADGKERLPNPAGDLDRILALTVAPDGKSVLTGSKNQVIRRWNLADGRSLQSFQAIGRELHGLAFAPDATVLAVGRGLAVELWDVATGRRLWDRTDFRRQDKAQPFRLPETGSLAFSSDGRRLATVTSGQEDSRRQQSVVRVWETSTGKLLALIDRAARIAALPVFSGDGRSVALLEYKLEGERRLTGIGLRLFEADTGRLLREKDSQELFANAAALAPDGKTLATASGGQISFRDVATGNLLFTLWGQRSGISLHQLAFSPDGTRLAAAADSRTGIVQVWEIATGKQTHELAVEALDLRFAPDSRRLVVGQRNGTVVVWDLADPATARQPRRELTPQEIEARWRQLGYGYDSSRGNAGNYARTDAMIEGGDRTVAFLETMLLRPDLPQLDQESVRRLIAPLADPRRSVRDKAVAEIARWGDHAWLSVADLGEAPASAEALQGLEQVLLNNLAYRRSSHGAIDVLYQIATPRARRLLARLQEGPSATQELKNRATLAGYRLEELERLRLRRAE